MRKRQGGDLQGLGLSTTSGELCLNGARSLLRSSYTRHLLLVCLPVPQRAFFNKLAWQQLLACGMVAEALRLLVSV